MPALPLRALGRTGLRVSRIGLGSSYGLPEREVLRAFDAGINYFYWGAMPRPAFGRAIKELARRDRASIVVALHASRIFDFALELAVKRQLKRAQLEYADALVLGWRDRMPSEKLLERVARLRERGLIKHVIVSCHNRPQFAAYINDARFDAIMVRYNAAHTGAEREVFPLVREATRRPGVIAYTATRWGTLLDPRHTPSGERTPRASDCYRFALAQPEVDLCLAGPASGAELDDALDALGKGPLAEDELAWMRRVGAAARKKLGFG